MEIDHLPLRTFDARTRFALNWIRVYGTSVVPKSDARWQLLSADLPRSMTDGVLRTVPKGTRFASSADSDDLVPSPESAVIDVAWALARAWKQGLDEVASVFSDSERDPDDQYLWAAIGFLSAHLPEADSDAAAWTALVRNRRAVTSATRGHYTVRDQVRRSTAAEAAQTSLFDRVEEA